MKTNLEFWDYENNRKSTCADHFEISESSAHLEWTTILVEKGRADFFSPQNVYSKVFMLTVELSNTFSWEVSVGEKAKNVTTSTGSIWINSPNTPINHVNNNPAEFLTLAVTPETLFDHFDLTVPFDKVEFITDYSVEDKTLESIIQLFYQETLSNNSNGCSYVDHLLDVLSNYFINNYSNLEDIQSGNTLHSTLTETDLASIDSYVHANMAESITIDDLADNISMNKFHFLNEFKKLTGMTPYQHILNMRINKAKELLTTSSDTLVNIALDTGFNDSSHFGRTFKKHTGVTPLKFRKSNPYV